MTALRTARDLASLMRPGAQLRRIQAAAEVAGEVATVLGGVRAELLAAAASDIHNGARGVRSTEFGSAVLRLSREAGRAAGQVLGAGAIGVVSGFREHVHGEAEQAGGSTLG